MKLAERPSSVATGTEKERRQLWRSCVVATGGELAKCIEKEHHHSSGARVCASGELANLVPIRRRKAKRALDVLFIEPVRASPLCWRKP